MKRTAGTSYSVSSSCEGVVGDAVRRGTASTGYDREFNKSSSVLTTGLDGSLVTGDAKQRLAKRMDGVLT